MDTGGIVDNDDWIDLEPDTKAKAGQARAPVRFAMGKGGRADRKGKARGRVTIDEATFTALKLANHRVRIRIGQGARCHQIAIVGDEHGPFELNEITMGRRTAATPRIWRVSLPLVAHWPDIDLPSMEVAHRIEGGKQPILVVDLPRVVWDKLAALPLPRTPSPTRPPPEMRVPILGKVPAIDSRRFPVKDEPSTSKLTPVAAAPFKRGPGRPKIGAEPGGLP
jgi:hypothetical protein